MVGAHIVVTQVPEHYVAQGRATVRLAMYDHFVLFFNAALVEHLLKHIVGFENHVLLWINRIAPF